MTHALRCIARTCVMLLASSFTTSFLLAGETVDLRLTLQGHTDEVKSVCFSFDGTAVASGSLDKTVRVWDVATGKAIFTFSKFDEKIDTVAFSPTEVALAWGARGQIVRLRSAPLDRNLASSHSARMGRVADWLAPSPQVNCVAFSPNAKKLAFGGDASLVTLANVYGKKTTSIELADRQVFSLAFSPDGKRLAVGGYEGIHLLGLDPISSPGVVHKRTEPIFGIAFGPDGKEFATAGRDKTVRLWDSSAARKISTLAGHTSDVFCVAFSPDGRTLASGSADRTVRFWDLASGRNSLTVQAHQASVFSLAFSPDGRTLATCGADKTVKLWDIDTSDR